MMPQHSTIQTTDRSLVRPEQGKGFGDLWSNYANEIDPSLGLLLEAAIFSVGTFWLTLSGFDPTLGS